MSAILFPIAIIAFIVAFAYVMWAGWTINQREREEKSKRKSINNITQEDRDFWAYLDET
jgi:hypothetical protein